jgi:hypothetical protein
MRRFLRIFELTKNEQRVVLIVMLALIAIAFVAYERRLYRRPTIRNSAASATPAQAGQ